MTFIAGARPLLWPPIGNRPAINRRTWPGRTGRNRVRRSQARRCLCGRRPRPIARSAGDVRLHLCQVAHDKFFLPAAMWTSSSRHRRYRALGVGLIDFPAARPAARSAPHDRKGRAPIFSSSMKAIFRYTIENCRWPRSQPRDGFESWNGHRIRSQKGEHCGLDIDKTHTNTGFSHEMARKRSSIGVGESVSKHSFCFGRRGASRII